MISLWSVVDSEFVGDQLQQSLCDRDRQTPVLSCVVVVVVDRVVCCVKTVISGAGAGGS